MEIETGKLPYNHSGVNEKFVLLTALEPHTHPYTAAFGAQVKGFLLDLGWTSAIMAERHDHWLQHQVLVSESSVLTLTLKHIVMCRWPQTDGAGS